MYLLVISLLICVSISKGMTNITHKETNQDDESMIMTCENKTSEVYTNHSLIASPPYPSPTFSVNCHFFPLYFFLCLGPVFDYYACFLEGSFYCTCLRITIYINCAYRLCLTKPPKQIMKWWSTWPATI